MMSPDQSAPVMRPHFFFMRYHAAPAIAARISKVVRLSPPPALALPPPNKLVPMGDDANDADERAGEALPTASGTLESVRNMRGSPLVVAGMTGGGTLAI